MEHKDLIKSFLDITCIDEYEKWNDETSPNSKNYFSKQESVVLSVTTETPYFGVTDGMGKISQEAMLELGRSFGRSIAEYIREN